MKKYWTMKVAAMMLALTLITSCFVGGTFAKYVTSGSGSDTARVAKFGVNITAQGTLFATEYDDGVAVKSVISTDDKVVAPGTSGHSSSVTITGKPEVAVRVSYDNCEVTISDNWKDKNDNFYCPLKVSIGQKSVTGTNYNSAADFKKAIEDEIKSYTKDLPAGTDLAQAESGSLAISWEWPYESGNDEKDTYLGDQAAKNNAATISIGVSVTVTQID